MESWEGVKERVGATARRGREATEEVSNVCATRGSENEGRGRVEKKETDAREVRRLCERIYVRGHHNCVFMPEYHFPFKHYVSASLTARARHIMFLCASQTVNT